METPMLSNISELLDSMHFSSWVVKKFSGNGGLRTFVCFLGIWMPGAIYSLYEHVCCLSSMIFIVSGALGILLLVILLPLLLLTLLPISESWKYVLNMHPCNIFLMIDWFVTQSKWATFLDARCHLLANSSCCNQCSLFEDTKFHSDNWQVFLLSCDIIRHCVAESHPRVGSGA